MPGLSSSNLAIGRQTAPIDVLFHTPAPRAAKPNVDWRKIAEELAPIECDLSSASVRRKSRDFFWFSPVLSTQLADVVADLVVSPKSEDELATLVRFCVARGLPLTPRGAGTGNYGQAMPLHGGVVVDLTALDGVKWLKGGIARVGAGMSLLQIEAEIQPLGWELRFHPSTWKTATVGGFIAGGSSGIGAINYGTLSQAGNILGLRMLTIEDEPRFIELRGPDVCKAIHAYGTTGLITEVELALAPATPWFEFVVSTPSIMDAVRLADRVAHADGVVKKELAPIDWGGAQYFDALLPYMTPGQPVLMAMIAESSVEPFADMVAESGSEIVFLRGPDEEKNDPPPLWEYCWYHTTLQALKHDRRITYLQILFDAPNYVEKVAHMVETFGDEVPVHLEFARLDGVVKCFGLQLVRFTTEDRLEEIMRYHWMNGCPVFNPHTYILESGGGAVADPAQYALKLKNDPHGLLNPGKMPGWDVPEGGFFNGAG